MWTAPAICFAVAAFLFLLSLPGLAEQIRELAEFIGMSGAEWHWYNYLGVSAGLLGMCLSAYPLWRRVVQSVHASNATIDWQSFYTFLREYGSDLAKLFALLLLLGGVLGLLYYLLFVHQPTRTVWIHPTLSVAEQDKAKADCKMRAFEAIGGSQKFAAIGARNDYRAACLTAKGFKSERVDD